MSFKDLPPDQLKIITAKGNQASRPLNAIKAWDKANQIRKERSQTSIDRLAKKYGVDRKTIYRILNSK